ncbi:DUF4861 family protein [Croceicoccus hydrothermalis]|uniref:DUF4861 family protein n=1 Tax=Croceicoccus hydrothermalis TaxID=2867964 RepID=UPI001EFAE758|nr:DUF4861 family protein [Croceicoccus hydrothermalis]
MKNLIDRPAGRLPLAAMTGALLLGAAPQVLLAKDGDDARPPQAGTLPPPADRNAAAVVTLADYRYDDLLWENDRAAYRIYGRPLEAAEPPSGSGIDAWGKKVRWAFADRQLRTGDQHSFHGEGIDFYNVGTGRGAGGLGIWHDNKLWTSRNYERYRIVSSGGDIADFSVDYAPWPVDLDRSVRETRRFTLPLGTHFTRMVSTITSNTDAPLLVGIGIGKRATGPQAGELRVDEKRGVLSWWGPQDGEHGRMAVALRVDPAMIAEVRQDFDNHLVILRVRPGEPFVYYAGSAWSMDAGGFDTQEKWNAYAAGEMLDFTPPGEGN